MIFIGSYWRVGCANKWKWTHLTKYSFKIEWYIFELKHDEYKVVDCNSSHLGPPGKGTNTYNFYVSRRIGINGLPKRTINSMVGKKGVRGMNALYDLWL